MMDFVSLTTEDPVGIFASGATVYTAQFHQLVIY